MDVVGELPPELGRRVMSYLGARDLGACTMVSRRWRQLADSPLLWKRLCLRYGWTDTSFVDTSRSHAPPHPATGEESGLWELNKWARNFGIHYRLPTSWEKRRSVEYLLSPENSAVTSMSCDERVLVLGHADGRASLLDVWAVPCLRAGFQGLLPSFKVLAVQVSSSSVVLVQSMLLQIFREQGSGYRLVGAKSFELGYSMIEVLDRYQGPADAFSLWYSSQVAPDKYTKEKIASTINFHIHRETLFVAVRDYQMIYGWSLEDGKRVNTIHIPNRNCKLRDFSMRDGFMYIIYGSRNVRHITVYDTTANTFLYELTTPECKTQKLLVGEYLVGVAIAGAGLTSAGVLKVWERRAGREVASRRTGCLSPRTVAILYDLVAYAEAASVHVWEPRRDVVLRTLSVSASVAFLQPCPFRFLLVVTHSASRLWDWLHGTCLYRIHHQTVKTADYRLLIHVDQTMILVKVDDSVVQMIAYC